MVRGMFVAVVAALSLSGCGPSEEPPEDVDLFREYSRSTDVLNDPYPSVGVSSEDRLANFASMGPPEAVQSSLLSATECAADCPVGAVPRAAAEEFGGTLFRRLVLVKHSNGDLELVALYVAQKSKNDAILIDTNGQTYRDLPDFRENNDVLTAEDLVLAPENITSVPGEGKIVTVYGHTETNWLPWLLGAGGALVLLVVALVIRRRVGSASG